MVLHKCINSRQYQYSRPMAPPTTIRNWVTENNAPTANLLALLIASNNPEASESMQKACAAAWKELSDITHTRCKRERGEEPKETKFKKKATITHVKKNVDPSPNCSSESDDSDSDSSIDLNTGNSFFQGKFN